MTPGRQPKHTMDSLTTNKRERLDREGWEALGALRELPELSRPEEPVSTVVSGPLHFHRATAPLWGFGLPARSPQRLFGYVVLSLLPPNKGSKQDQQGASTALRRPCRELLLPPLLGASAHARPQAASRAGLPGSWALHSGCFYMGPFWVQQTRESLGRDAGSPRGSLGTAEVLWDWRGEEESLITTPSTSIGLARSLSRCSGLRARSKPILARTKGASRSHKALLHTPGFPTQSRSCWVGRCPRHLIHLIDSYQPAKTALHRACFYMWSLFHDWERQLLCLIHINKHRKSNKIKSQKKNP